MTNEQPDPSGQPQAERPYPEQYPAEPSAPYQQQPYPQQYPQPRNRPLGATILAILAALSGLFYLLVSLSSFALAALFASDALLAEIEKQMGYAIPQYLVELGTIFFAVLGVLILIVAILSFLLTWGFWNGKKWSRVLAIIFLVFSIVTAVIGGLGSFDFLSLGVAIIIPVLALVYLYLPEAKAWFTQ